MPYTNLNNTTQYRRSMLKGVIDKFCTFNWDSVDAFEQYGMFIINKNDLKFYNGPSFSNEYSKPQFANMTNVIGVNFQNQSISFKVGIYWFSIEEYRQLLKWLDPYTISTLAFSFDKDFGYQVKLTGREDSIRTIVGYEDNSPRYYTEMNLKFEVQGEQCARAQRPYTWEENNEQDLLQYKLTGYNYIKTTFDLPFKATTTIILSDKNKINWQLLVNSNALVNIDFKQVENAKELSLEYDSLTGLVYILEGDYKHLLTNKEDFVETFNINRYLLSAGEINNYSSEPYMGPLIESNYAISIECYAKTNVI